MLFDDVEGALREKDQRGKREKRTSRGFGGCPLYKALGRDGFAARPAKGWQGWFAKSTCCQPSDPKTSKRRPNGSMGFCHAFLPTSPVGVDPLS